MKPTAAQIDAAFIAARKAVDNYSAWASSMVPDDALKTVVCEALTAALNVPQPQTEGLTFMEQFLSLLPTLFSLVGPITNLITTGVSVNSVATTIQNPAVISAFEGLGAKLFPHAAPAMQVAAAIVTSYSPDYTKWIQNMLNAEGANPPLVVDGQYGPKTQAAVKQVQSKLGLTVDGWAGDLTSAALQAVLAKLKKAA